MRSVQVLFASLCAASAAPVAHATELEVDVGGMVQYDLRLRPLTEDYGDYWFDLPDPTGVARNEILGKLKASARMGRYGMKADVDVVYRHFPVPQDIADLSRYNLVSPFRIEAHSLYMEAFDFLLKNLDLRVGQQKAMFGVGDQFNPTNNVNANDLEDPLLFGDQIANVMARLDYTPHWRWQITGILIPVHKPALLPRNSIIAASNTGRLPFTDPEMRHNLIAELEFAERSLGYPTVVNALRPVMPDLSVQNMQTFLRVGGTIGAQDLALSWYRGFSDFPLPVFTNTSQRIEQICEDPDDPASDCVNGLLQNDVELGYPAMHVLGFNAAGEFNIFKGWLGKNARALGYRAEAALVIPRELQSRINQDDLDFGIVTIDGEYPYPNGETFVVDARPFPKWSLGLDYTFGRNVYLNAQWVHGFVDEFSAGSFIQPGDSVRDADVPNDAELLNCIDLTTLRGQGEECVRERIKPRIGDYLVTGVDVRFNAQAGLVRVFTILDLNGIDEERWDPVAGARVRTSYSPFTGRGFSAVLYPEFRYNFGNGFETHLGALVFLGKDYTKFGDPATGGSLLFFRGRFTF